MGEVLQNKYGRALTSVVLVFYFLFLIAYLFPKNEARNRLVEPFEVAWNYWRLDQYWALFSPGIRNINFHPTAVIRFEDGAELAWQFPKNSKEGFLDEYRGEKWRKLCIDSMPWPDFKEYWPDIARFLGKKYYDSSNKPVSFSLHLNWADTPKPEAKVSRDNFPNHTKFYTIFVYRYTARDFE